MLISLEKMTPLFLFLTNKNHQCNSCIFLSNLALVFWGGWEIGMGSGVSMEDGYCYEEL